MDTPYLDNSFKTMGREDISYDPSEGFLSNSSIEDQYPYEILTPEETSSGSQGMARSANVTVVTAPSSTVTTSSLDKPIISQDKTISDAGDGNIREELTINEIQHCIDIPDHLFPTEADRAIEVETPKGSCCVDEGDINDKTKLPEKECPSNEQGKGPDLPPPSSDPLINLGRNGIKKFFTDQYNDPYAQIMTDAGYIICPINSSDFRLWLNGRFFNHTGEACKPADLKSVCATFAAQATFAGAGRFTLEPRVAWHDGALWYDLGDPARGAVKISSTGWEVLSDVPIIFRRYKNQGFQVLPIQGGKAAKFHKFVNVTDPGDLLLIMVWLIVGFIPNIPHAILVVHGSQGAAKTFFFRKLKILIDPGQRLVETIHKSPRDLAICLHNQLLTTFDNLRTLSTWQSDGFCRATTGDSFSARALYTNGDEFHLSFQRPIALNGISICAVSPDILDRSIIIQLDRIPQESRRTEDDLDAEFAEALPEILGGIFDTISRAMSIYPDVRGKLSNLPRMADFTTWGYAIAEALGGLGQDFLDAYSRNISHHNQEILAENPVSEAMVHLMANHVRWSGSPSDLLKLLKGVAVEHQIKPDVKSWPSNASVLTKHLKTLQTNLFDAGIDVEFSRTNMTRRITITKIPAGMKNDTYIRTPSPTVTSSSLDNQIISQDISDDDGGDNIFPDIIYYENLLTSEASSISPLVL